MPNMMEPNVHPMVVHFVIAFLLTSTLAFAAIQMAPKQSVWRASLKSAADWMFCFGVIAAIAAVAAGLQAYYTVAHDGPSHAAMTVHRNIAIPTAAAFVLLGGWRWTRRKEFPSVIFSLAMLIAAGGLATTAWWGGRLVYGHGLGVMRMPQPEGPEGPGHQHEHEAAKTGHAEDGDAASVADHDHGDGEKAEPDHESMDMASPTAGGHDDSDGHHDAMKPGADAPGGHDNSDGHHDKPGAAASSDDGQNATSATTSIPVVEGEPAEIVDAFATALLQGDKQTLERLILPNVIIAEGGGTERSFAEYASHHMSADMAFLRATSTRLLKRDSIAGGDLTTVISENEISGTYKNEAVHSRMVETMVLRKTLGGWRIAHIHWSSAKITGDHEH